MSVKYCSFIGSELPCFIHVKQITQSAIYRVSHCKTRMCIVLLQVHSRVPRRMRNHKQEYAVHNVHVFFLYSIHLVNDNHRRQITSNTKYELRLFFLWIAFDVSFIYWRLMANILRYVRSFSWVRNIKRFSHLSFCNPLNPRESCFLLSNKSSIQLLNSLILDLFLWTEILKCLYNTNFAQY